MGISFFIYIFFIYAHFLQNTTTADNNGYVYKFIKINKKQNYSMSTITQIKIHSWVSCLLTYTIH
jgi:hypothetical protein